MPNVYSTTPDEKIIDSVISILNNAIPETAEEAMPLYTEAILRLKNLKDFRGRRIINWLEEVYIYPERELHNEVINSLHDLRETLHEEKLKRHFRMKGLGETRDSVSTLIHWVVLLVMFVALMGWRQSEAN